jgi:hypothetical protein
LGNSRQRKQGYAIQSIVFAALQQELHSHDARKVLLSAAGGVKPFENVTLEICELDADA